MTSYQRLCFAINLAGNPQIHVFSIPLMVVTVQRRLSRRFNCVHLYQRGPLRKVWHSITRGVGKIEELHISGVTVSLGSTIVCGEARLVCLL